MNAALQITSPPATPTTPSNVNGNADGGANGERSGRQLEDDAYDTDGVRARPTSMGRDSSATRPKPRGRPDLLRAKSDFGPRDSSRNSDADSKADSKGSAGELETTTKHGFDKQLATEEQMYSLNQVGICAFNYWQSLGV